MKISSNRQFKINIYTCINAMFMSVRTYEIQIKYNKLLTRAYLYSLNIQVKKRLYIEKHFNNFCKYLFYVYD